MTKDLKQKILDELIDIDNYLIFPVCLLYEHADVSEDYDKRLAENIRREAEYLDDSIKGRIRNLIELLKKDKK